MSGGVEERERLRELADGYEVVGDADPEFEGRSTDPVRGGEWVVTQLEPKPIPMSFSD
jgi:hypothetical protein